MRIWLLGIVIVLALAFFLKPASSIKSNLEFDIKGSELTQTQPQNKTINIDQAKQKEQQFENELAQQMSVVASRYEQSIRFPQYSIPINAGQTDLLQPLQVLPVVLNLGEGTDSNASLAPDSYVFFHGEPIFATLTSSGPIKPSQVKIELVENNNPLEAFKVSAKERKFVGTIETSDPDWPVDLHIKATFHFGKHGKLSILSPIKYSPDNGSITAVNEASVDGANLSIPVELDIKQPGRYRLSVNFFNQNKIPLAHLSAKQNLKKGKNNWILQVHSEVLRSANDAGPYLLDTWTLTKLPERPGIRTSYGSSKVSETKVAGFELKSYDSTPWSDPQEQARLQFFKKLQ